MDLIRLNEAGPFQKREYLIKDVLPVGFPAMLYAAPQHGKSAIAAHIAVCLAAKIPWLGREVKQSPVIYADLELTTQEIYHRFWRISQGLGLNDVPDGIWYLPAAEEGYELSDIMIEAEKMVKETGARLVIIDSLTIGLQVDPNDAKETIKTLRAAKWLNEQKACILFLDHQSKVQHGENYNEKRPYGSILKEAICRIIIQLELDGQQLKFHYTKNNFSAMSGTSFSAFVEWNNDDEGPIIVKPIEFRGLTGQQAAIGMLLEQQPMKKAEIVEVIGNTGLMKDLKLMVERGIVYKRNSTYYLVESSNGE